MEKNEDTKATTQAQTADVGGSANDIERPVIGLMIEISVWQTRPGRRWKLSPTWPFISRRNNANALVHHAWTHPRWGNIRERFVPLAFDNSGINERLIGYDFSPRIAYPENADIGPAERPTTPTKKQKAKAMRDAGFSFRDIAAELNVDEATAKRYARRERGS